MNTVALLPDWLGWTEVLLTASIPFAVSGIKWWIARLPEWVVVYIPMIIAAMSQFVTNINFGDGAFGQLGFIVMGAVATILRQVMVKGIVRPVAQRMQDLPLDKSTPVFGGKFDR